MSFHFVQCTPNADICRFRYSLSENRFYSGPNGIQFRQEICIKIWKFIRTILNWDISLLFRKWFPFVNTMHTCDTFLTRETWRNFKGDLSVYRYDGYTPCVKVHFMYKCVFWFWSHFMSYWCLEFVYKTFLLCPKDISKKTCFV